MLPFIKRTMSYIITRLHLLILALLLVLYFEYLARDSMKAMFIWSWEQSSPFRLNYIIVLALLMLFISICGQTWIAYLLLASLMTLVGFVTGVKLKFLGVPLMPWDVL